MTLYFRCKDIKDYARITSGKFSPEMNPTSHDIKYAKRTGGIAISGSLIPKLDGAIIAENSGFLGYHFKPLIESENTRKHEEQHAIKRLFEEKVSKDIAWERFENAKSTPTLNFLKRLASVFGGSVKVTFEGI